MQPQKIIRFLCSQNQCRKMNSFQQHYYQSVQSSQQSYIMYTSAKFPRSKSLKTIELFRSQSSLHTKRFPQNSNPKFKASRHLHAAAKSVQVKKIHLRKVTEEITSLL
jgi:hypothetical protein